MDKKNNYVQFAFTK